MHRTAIDQQLGVQPRCAVAHSEYAGYEAAKLEPYAEISSEKVAGTPGFAQFPRLRRSAAPCGDWLCLYQVVTRPSVIEPRNYFLVGG